MMKNNIIKHLFMGIVGIMFVFSSCDYLDVVPEGVSRLENAFTMRNQAEKFLYTCYSYMPPSGNLSSDPAILGGDEMWTIENPLMPVIGFDAFNIARGYQNASSPLIDYWGHFYMALRDCNIFLENIPTVPDLEPWERDQWISEVKVLKAYYHYCLVKMYGTVPIIKDNLDVDVDMALARVHRNTVDECFDYIVELIDEASPALPIAVRNKMDELGRITQAIALSLKAKALVTAASPLYNGNTDMATLVDNKETQLFNQTKDVEKWKKAVEACKEAVELCVDKLGMELYEYPGNPQFDLAESTLREITLRNAFTEKWNSDIIWANTQSQASQIQLLSMPKLDIRYVDYAQLKTILGVPIKVAEMFYSDNGVPITEDKTWDYANRYDFQIAEEKDKLLIKQGSQTIKMHFNREPRFYAYIGFDTGMWYGQGVFDDSNPNKLFSVACRKGQQHGKAENDMGPVTAYFPKKYVNIENVQNSVTSITIKNYPWPLIRLSDLFLLYAEALNEAADNEQSRALAIEYIDKVRDRAGLKGVEESWSQYSTNSTKYKSQVGLRDIIQKERLIELCFEGQRFWDLRRWKTAMDNYKIPMRGWDISQNTPLNFYRLVLVAQQTFGIKDYFWPIRDNDIVVNRNLIQNIGW